MVKIVIDDMNAKHWKQLGRKISALFFLWKYYLHLLNYFIICIYFLESVGSPQRPTLTQRSNPWSSCTLTNQAIGPTYLFFFFSLSLFFLLKKKNFKSWPQSQFLVLFLFSKIQTLSMELIILAKLKQSFK